MLVVENVINHEFQLCFFNRVYQRWYKEKGGIENQHDQAFLYCILTFYIVIIITITIIIYNSGNLNQSLAF